ncbi:MAG: DEAD/DEAH box helicase family protein, partial [Candidatus Altiarchaeota archaeon]|nr:DEAD/DEAH box helicase family protein [Candidatus Altiarchaeota archaeon]
MQNVISGIIGGSDVRDIIVKATPGSGKSSLPIIAGGLVTAGLADSICWVCPRMSLQDQAERNFVDPFFRRLLNHNLAIRSSTNEVNPCRGTNGFVTTYQAVGVDKRQTMLKDFRKKRYILVLDEYHHAEEEGPWTQALIPLYDKAAYRVLMTGTMARGDGKKIAFTP